ncbi:hypothetical protein HK096_000314 [Nowakowskiella sp. JEL0078]|nr:hypothetical protein HK096_000314 [Nowakowskiella sp. JEL0078]
MGDDGAFRKAHKLRRMTQAEKSDPATCETMKESYAAMPLTPVVALVGLCCTVLVSVLLCAKPDREMRHKQSSLPLAEMPPDASKLTLLPNAVELDDAATPLNSAVRLRASILATDPIDIHSANFAAANHPVAVAVKNNVLLQRSFSALSENSSGATDRARGIGYRPIGVEVFQVVVSYARAKSDELDLMLGERILLRKVFRDGWCEGVRIRSGENVGEVGIFPVYCISGDSRVQGKIESRRSSIASQRDSLARSRPGHSSMEREQLLQKQQHSRPPSLTPSTRTSNQLLQLPPSTSKHTSFTSSDGVLSHYELQSPQQTHLPSPPSLTSSNSSLELETSDSKPQTSSQGQVDVPNSIVSSTPSSPPSLVSSVDASSHTQTLFSRAERQPGVTRSDTIDSHTTNLMRSDSTATSMTFGSPPSLASSASSFSAFEGVNSGFGFRSKAPLAAGLTIDTSGKHPERTVNEIKPVSALSPNNVSQADELEVGTKMYAKSISSVVSINSFDQTNGFSLNGSSSGNVPRQRDRSGSRGEHPEVTMKRTMEAVLAMTTGFDEEENVGTEDVDSRKSMNARNGGTRRYMAPEVIQRLGHGKPVDLWSIGVLSYFLLCGYLPFDAESQADELQNILMGSYTFPEENWGEISNEAKDFIKKLLVVKPEDRLTALEALKHPWLANFNKMTEGDVLPLARDRIKKNSERRTYDTPVEDTTADGNIMVLS